MVRPRRNVVIALVVAAAALIALGIVSAAGIGYHFDDGGLRGPEHHQGYVYLHIFGDFPELGILAAFVMLFAASHIGIVRRRIRISSMTAAGVAAAIMALFCWGDALLVSSFGERNGSTVATSGEYEVVRYRTPRFLDSSGDVVLHLRSRNGLASYESGADLACFIDDSSGAGPEWLFDRASLTPDDTVQVTAKDGTTWLVRFDPHTLLPVNPIDRCTDAPDQSADW